MSKRSSQKRDAEMSEKLSSSERRPKYSRSDLMRMARVDLVNRFIILQNLNIKFLEEVKPMMAKSKSDLASAQEVGSRLQAQVDDHVRKEAFLNMRLNSKHLETHDLMTQVQEMRAFHMDGATSHLNHRLLDPAIKHVFERMRTELESQKHKCKQATEDASALAFNPDSELGKRLVAKCRQLSQENSELSEEVAKLDYEVAVERQVVRETRTQQLEFERFQLEMEEQLESLQAVVVSQNCSIKHLTSRLTQATKHKQLLQSQLERKCPPQKDASCMVVEGELVVREGRVRLDGEGVGREVLKKKEEHARNNHVSRASSKGRSKKGKVEKVEKERVDKDKVEKERRDKGGGADKEKGEKERGEKDKGDRSSEKTRKRGHESREAEKKGRYRSRSRTNHDVSNGHRSNYK